MTPHDKIKAALEGLLDLFRGKDGTDQELDIMTKAEETILTTLQNSIVIDKGDATKGLADSYVWSVSGDGASTSRGIRTRAMIKDAFISGFNAAQLIQAQMEE